MHKERAARTIVYVQTVHATPSRFSHTTSKNASRKKLNRIAAEELGLDRKDHLFFNKNIPGIAAGLM